MASTQARAPARATARHRRVLRGRTAYWPTAGAVEPTSRTRHTAATRTDLAGGDCPDTRPGIRRAPAGTNPLDPVTSPLPALMRTQAQASRRPVSATTAAIAGVTSSGATPWRTAAAASPNCVMGAVYQGASPVVERSTSTVGMKPTTSPATTALIRRWGQMVRIAPAGTRVRAAISVL